MTGRLVVVRGPLLQQPRDQSFGDQTDRTKPNPSRRHAPILADTARRLVAGLFIHRASRSLPASTANALNLKALEMHFHGEFAQEIPARV